MTSSERPREIKIARRRAGILACVAAAWMAVCTGSPGQTPAPEAAGETGMAALGRMVPLGYISRQVRIPSFADDGTVASVLTAETIVRIDDDHLQAGKSAVEIVGKIRAEDIRVDLQSAIYDMGDRLLRSGDRSTVRRSDFQVEGDSMVFNADTAQGQMKGRVRTIIFDTSALSGKEAAPKPAN